MSSSIQRSAPMRVERFETVVIGAGQAGLAVGHHLAALDNDFVVLSDEEHIGDNWRRRWDSLRLFTPARYSGLPGMHFPAPSDHFADKDEVADYLASYSSRFDLPVRLRARATSVASHGNRFLVQVNGATAVLEADNVIVATGAFQQPHVPSAAARLANEIHQLHSTEYQNPFELPDGSVLVVGAGNSGAQIALEIARFRKVWLAGRNTGHTPRTLLGRDLFTWAWPVMKLATSDTRIGRRMQARMRSRGDPLLGIPERQLSSAGVIRVGRLEGERGGQPVCGAEVIEPRVIIWCTGFKPDFRWIGTPMRDDGYPRNERGVVTETPGLFFLGLRFQHRLNSSLIGGVGEDAAFIARMVAQRTDVLMQAAPS